MALITYTTCPACFSSDIAIALTAKDYTVSKKTFPIWECRSCTLRFTQDIPNALSIGAYYQSEDYISHSDSQKGLINKLYHIIRKRTLWQKQQLVEKETGTRKGRLLDIGAGTGAFCYTMQQAGWTAEGLEPDAPARKLATERYGLQLQAGDRLFSLPAGQYDAITLWHVLEHVHALHEYLDQLKRLLKPGGRLFVAVPNYQSYDAAAYGSYWAAWDTPRHLYHFSPKAMKQLLHLHQLPVYALKPMWFDSFYVSMLSEQYKTGKPDHAAAVLTGIKSNRKAMGDVEKCSSVIYIAENKA